jgi:hypothetical protein
VGIAARLVGLGQLELPHHQVEELPPRLVRVAAHGPLPGRAQLLGPLGQGLAQRLGHGVARVGKAQAGRQPGQLLVQ